jgi:Tol biopolymer transport system component
MTYVRDPDFSLWVSQPDGRAASKIEFTADDLELPRWSPDGKWIAFSAKVSGRPYRIFVVPSSGGSPREVSAGTDSQGAPTWSPDSKWLVYGNVNCQETGTCAIHKIDFSTGLVHNVPGSEGLCTARWSPDGRFIAALLPEKQQVLVFNEASMRWRKLADEVNGNDLSWSSDSRYLFASEPSGNRPRILRVSVKDGTVDTAVDLSSFAKWSGLIDTWFALTPTGSIIFRRGISTEDIYALSYEDR